MSSASSSQEMDPVLKDLSDRKQTFRQNVVSLAAQLKDAREQLAAREDSCARESRTRQAAEQKIQSMEFEISELGKRLKEKEGLLQASTDAAKQCLQEMDSLRTQLSDTQAAANEHADAAQAAQLQCSALMNELNEKKASLKENDYIMKLTEQLEIMQRELHAREASQKHLKDEIVRIEQDVIVAVTTAAANKDFELTKILGDPPRSFDKINKLLTAKDDEIARLREEVRVTSASWKLKAKELESELEKHRKAYQELKKRALKLEFCLQEARSQTRKLQRAGERRDKVLKELKDMLVSKQGEEDTNKRNFWDSSSFKLIVSMSMLVLVVFAKR